MTECPYHKDLMLEIKELNHLLQDLATWKAINEELKRVSNGNYRSMDQELKEIKEALINIQVLMANTYITKGEFEKISQSFTLCKEESSKKRAEIYRKVDEGDKELREYVWKVMVFVFMIGGTAFGLIQWILSLFVTKGGD